MIRILILLLAVLSTLSVDAQKPISEVWKDLVKLEQSGRPQSALQLLDSIVKVTESTNDYPHLIKAHLYRIALFQQYLPNPQQEYLNYLHEKYENAPFPVKEIIAFPLAKAILNVELENGSGTAEPVERAKLLIDYTLSNLQLFELSTADYTPILKENSFHPKDYQVYWQIDTSYTTDGTDRQPTLMDVLIKEAEKLYRHPLLNQQSLNEKYIQTAQHFHQKNLDTTAWLFNLLEYGSQELPELLKLYHQFPRPEILLKIGTYYWNHNESAKAIPIFERIIQAHHGTYEAAMAKKNLDQIRKPFFNVKMAEVVTSSSPLPISIETKNVQQLYYRILPIDISSWMAIRRKAPNDLLAHLPIRNPTLTKISSDDTLPNPGYGQYILLVSNHSNPLSARENAELKLLFFQVSDMSFFQTSKGPQKQIVVTNANTGAPKKEVVFEFFENPNYQMDGFDDNRPTAVLTSNQDGVIYIPSSLPNRTVFRIINHSDTLYNDDFLINSFAPIPIKDSISKSYIITDKAIYQPGAEVFYKIIHYQSILAAHPQILSQVPLTVALYNLRGELQSTQKVITNEFGSAIGSFKIPEGEWNGNWSLKIEEDQSSRSFLVEEYALPEIELKLTFLNERPKAGDTLLLSGQVQSFSGRNPTGAKVNIALMAQEVWYRSRMIPSGKDNQPIWTGEAYTDANGQFIVAIPTDKEPGRYQIKADVFTLTGSRCEGHLPLMLGIYSMKPAMKIPDQVVAYQPFAIELQLSNVLNQPSEASFHLSIRSKKEERILFQEFGWLRGSKSLPVALKDTISGPLMAELLIYEDGGVVQKLEQELILIDQDFKYRSPEKGFLYHLSNNSFQKGDTLKVKWASDIPIYFLWESDNGTVDQFWTNMDSSKIAKTLVERSGVLHLIGTKDHKFFHVQEPIEVSQNSQNLIIKYDQFTTTLIPGQKVKWDFSLTNPEGKTALAEVASVLYNKALEERALQSWIFPFAISQNYPSLYVSSGLSQTARTISWQHSPVKPIYYPPIHRPILEDYISNFNLGSPLIMRSEVSAMAGEKRAGNPEDAPVEESPGEMLDQPNSFRRIGEEVVYFKPIIRTSKKGLFSLEFDAPTTLSDWKLKIFAIDKNLNGLVEERVVTTYKPFFLDPYVPRFLRRGDTFSWKVPLANLTDDGIEGTANLLLIDPVSKKDITYMLVDKSSMDFSVATHSETYVDWSLNLKESTWDHLDFVMSASSDLYEDRIRSNISILTDEVNLSENLPVFLPPFLTDTIVFDWKSKPEFTYVNNPLEWVWEVLPTFFDEEPTNNTIQLINQRFAAVLGLQMQNEEYLKKIEVIDEWLAETQNIDGGFSWFPKGRSNPYITFYLLDLSSRMKSVSLPKDMVKKAINYINQSKLPTIYTAYINAQWGQHKKSQGLNIDDWSGYPPALKIMLGRYYHLVGENQKAHSILLSLKETALGNFDTGIYWARESWGGALQLTSEALLFFWELGVEKEWIQGLQIELLKHKRLNGWGNSKATALAISALWTTFPEAKERALQKIQYEWIRTDQQTYLVVANPNSVPAWGALTQKYTQNIEDVEAYHRGPLKLERSYFYENKEEWVPIEDSMELKIGQTVKVVLNIENETPMQTIVLRDEFPAAAELPFEPSRYRWDRNVFYFQTRDKDAMLFYFDELPRGTHQVTYSYKLGRGGTFHTGISTLTSAYDDAFGSFDENLKWTIK